MVIRHGADLRRGRYSQGGNYYLLTSVVAGRRPIFADFRAARLLVNALRDRQEAGQVKSLAFVVMPDHLPWLVELRRGDLPQVMRLAKGGSARLVNLRLSLAGPLWQEGYHDHALRRDEDLVAAARYLVANPLRAGLVEKLHDYPHWDAVWL